jgi:glyoxylase-like metal-dependent hydrolase (beta-lactamase superfamily II)
MIKSLSVAALALAFAPAPHAADAPAKAAAGQANASTSEDASDAAALLKRAAAAMGADGLRTLVYSGSGTGASYGQAYVPTAAWPRLTYSRYSRQLDYDNVYIGEEVTRARAEPKGGGAVPLSGEAPFGGFATATHAWQAAGGPAVARQAALTGRLHDLWITPHGVLKAAAKHGATLAFRTEGKRSLAAVSFKVPGILTATAYINDAYIVERVESRVPDAVLGDTSVVTTYSNYRDFGSVRFPTRIEQKQAGSTVLDVTISDVKPNAPVNAAVPANVASATERATTEKVAEGVWFIAGGSHNSVAIEMKDHIILVESPLYDGRASVVLDAANKLVPGKRVRQVVNSHNHFDHAGGLRAAVAQGATIVTNANAAAFYAKAFANPNRIAPDLLAKSGKKARIVGVKDKLVISDGKRTVELHQIKDNDHADTFLMAWLPAEKLLVEADLFTPGAPNAPAPAQPNAYHVSLIKNIDRLGMKPERILPLHGRVVPYSELMRMVGK